MATFDKLKARGLGKGAFGKQVLTLMVGTTIAQALPIAVSPILTRLYQPSDFGILVLFTSIVGMVGIIATGRYEMAIVLPDKEEDAANLLGLSITVTFCVCLALLLVVWLFNAKITSMLGNAEVGRWLYLTPVSVVMTGLYQSFTFWCSRQEKFKRLAISRVSQSGATAAGNVIMGAARLGTSGLIGGTLLGQAISTIVLAGQVWKGDRGKARSVTIGKMVELGIRYKDFPLVNSVHAFIDVVQSSGLVFLISAYFSTIVLGLYSFVIRILKMPLSLIGGAVSQVFFQKASMLYNEGGNLSLLVKKTMLRLTLIAIPIFLVLVFFAPILFSTLFGANWRLAGEYARILSPWVLFNFIFSPVSGVYLIVGKQKQAILFGILDTLLKIGSILVGAYFQSPKMGFYCMSGTGIVVLGMEVIWTFSILKAPRLAGEFLR